LNKHHPLINVNNDLNKNNFVNLQLNSENNNYQNQSNNGINNNNKNNSQNNTSNVSNKSDGVSNNKFDLSNLLKENNNNSIENSSNNNNQISNDVNKENINNSSLSNNVTNENTRVVKYNLRNNKNINELNNNVTKNNLNVDNVNKNNNLNSNDLNSNNDKNKSDENKNVTENKNKSKNARRNSRTNNKNKTRKKELENSNDFYKQFKFVSNYNVVSYNSLENELPPPENFEDIFGRPDEAKWLEAVYEELNNMTEKEVYTFVKVLPKYKNKISIRWIFSYKRDSEGKIVKYKARLVARGFTQIYGVDYVDIFSPTLKQDSLRMLIGIAIHYGYNIYQIDIKAEYLNADIDEELYTDVPPGD